MIDASPHASDLELSRHILDRLDVFHSTMHAECDGLRNAQRPVHSSPWSRVEEHNDSWLVHKEPSHGIDAQTPALRDLLDAEVTLKSDAAGLHHFIPSAHTERRRPVSARLH